MPKRQGIRYALKAVGTIWGPQIRVTVEWPEPHPTTHRDFSTRDLPLAEVRRRARQWARDAIDDFKLTERI
jgi:hypothetical protein